MFSDRVVNGEKNGWSRGCKDIRIPKMNAKALPLVFILTVLPGCKSVVQTKTLPPATTAPLNGMPYYLPKGVIRVDGTWSKDAKEWQVKASLVVEPDATKRFLLARNSNVMFDDAVVLAVNSSGLLESVTATTEDKSAASLGDVAASVGGVLTFGASLGAGAGLRPFIQPPLAPEPSLPTSFHLAFDTSAQREFRAEAVVADFENRVKAKFVVQIQPLSVPANQNPTTANSVADSANGVFVKLFRPYSVAIETTIDPDGSSLRLDTPNQILVVPDPFETHVVPLKRRPLVKNDTKLTLTNGALQKFDVTRPSIVAGILGVPKTIIGQIAPIPLNIQQTQANTIQAINNGQAAQQQIRERANPPQ